VRSALFPSQSRAWGQAKGACHAGGPAPVPSLLLPGGGKKKNKKKTALHRCATPHEKKGRKGAGALPPAERSVSTLPVLTNCPKKKKEGGGEKGEGIARQFVLAHSVRGSLRLPLLRLIRHSRRQRKRDSLASLLPSEGGAKAEFQEPMRLVWHILGLAGLESKREGKGNAAGQFISQRLVYLAEKMTSLPGRPRNSSTSFPFAGRGETLEQRRRMLGLRKRKKRGGGDFVSASQRGRKRKKDSNSRLFPIRTPAARPTSFLKKERRED